MPVKFYLGAKNAYMLKHFSRGMLSVSNLIDRKGGFYANDWMLDSGGFNELVKHGDYRLSVREYASHISKWKKYGNLQCAVSQDYVCFPEIRKITGKTTREHQELTIERYSDLASYDTGVYIMPVIQGYFKEEYLEHLKMYGNMLKPSSWVGVGSLVRDSEFTEHIKAILLAIKRERPDLLLHGFGLKKRTLKDNILRSMIYSADSSAWSSYSRKSGVKSSDWKKAILYGKEIESWK